MRYDGGSGPNYTPQVPVSSTVASNHWTPAGGNNNTDSVTWNRGTPLTRTSALQFILSLTNLLFILFSFFFSSGCFSTLQGYTMNTFLHKKFNVGLIIKGLQDDIWYNYGEESGFTPLGVSLMNFKVSSPAVLVESRSSRICSHSVVYAVLEEALGPVNKPAVPRRGPLLSPLMRSGCQTKAQRAARFHFSSTQALPSSLCHSLDQFECVLFCYFTVFQSVITR